MTEELYSKLRKFSVLAKKMFTPHAQVILFGSFAKGRNKEWSDIDVVVITPQVNDRIREEISLRLKSLEIDERINPFIFTRKEMQENSPFIWEIKKYGKKLF